MSVVIPENPERILLVEGQDDRHTIWHICRQDTLVFEAIRNGYQMGAKFKNSDSLFQITDKGNSSELLDSIEPEIQVAGRRVVGVVMDADGDLKGRWESLRAAFPSTVQMPEHPDPNGTILNCLEGMPRIGIWLMPDNQSPVELEDFVLKMIPTHDQTWKESIDFVDKIPPHLRKFPIEKSDKAKVYTWLSTRREPARIGSAIGSKDLEISGSLSFQFMKWLKALFG